MNDFHRIPEGILGEETVEKTNTELFLSLVGQYFPEAIKDGEVDFTALKEEMGEFPQVSSEHYEFTWAGKQAAKKEAQADLFGRTLKYKPQDSLNPDTTENIYIEGDNLEALKLLRRNYHGKIKMIYIDPPYNTGNDFVYHDDFSMTEDELAKKSGDVVDGIHYQKNIKDNSRYHTNWLNMMYPRLKIARELLSDDGVIFISIDDYEYDNLKKLCDNFFGNENMLANLIWDLGTGTTEGHFTRGHEYVLCYAKRKELLPNFKNFNKNEIISHGALKKISYKNPAVEITFPKGFEFDGDSAVFKGEIGDSEKEYILSPEMRFENGKLVAPTTIKAGFAMRNQVESFIAGKEVFDTKGQKVIRFYFNSSGILFYEKEKSVINPRTVLAGLGSTKNGTSEVTSLFDAKYFDFPKPTALINYLLKIVTCSDDIILDFFSGSATTAHAIMQLNAEDGGNRKFIMVQLPEKCEEKSEAAKAGYKNICEIGKERIRRAAKKIHEDNPDTQFDDGFKVFEVSDTNIKWNTNDDKEIIDLTEIDYSINDKDRIDFIKGYTDIDVVYEVMLRQFDIPLSTPIEKLSSVSDRTYIFADAVVVCLEPEIDEQLIERLAAIEPTPAKFVLRDSAFNDDIELKDVSFRRLSALIANHQTEEERKSKYNNYTVEFI